MSKVRTFSRVFPADHPRRGEQTHFVEKIWQSIYWDHVGWEGFEKLKSQHGFDIGLHGVYKPKHHTVRAGNHFKPGDYFDPRVWSKSPYNYKRDGSKQIKIAPDIKVEKTWNIGKMGQAFFMNDKLVKPEVLEQIAANDGLSYEDFIYWFSKEGIKERWNGQIICWNKDINY